MNILKNLLILVLALICIQSNHIAIGDFFYSMDLNAVMSHIGDFLFMLLRDTARMLGC